MRDDAERSRPSPNHQLFDQVETDKSGPARDESARDELGGISRVSHVRVVA